MGYTHYFYRPQKLGTQKKWNAFVEDVKKIFNYAENSLGIKLANGFGEPNSSPEANQKHISFNGSEEQPAGKWTTTEQITIPWPSPTASLTEPSDMPFEKTEGHWFAGSLVSQRVAPINHNTGLGSGSYETLFIERVKELQSYDEADENGLYFDCCKTAYRPYDLVVTAVLIALKHHFPKVKLSSDGEEKDWLDARFLCNNLLGYGMDLEKTPVG